MSPPQSIFQQQYLPPTNAYQHYPTSSRTATNIYQQQVTPDVYQFHYSNAANTHQPQYLVSQTTTDPYQQYRPMSAVSASTYQQQQSVSSIPPQTVDQEQFAVSSVAASTSSHQNDNAPNASHYVAESSFYQEEHISEPCKIKHHRNAENALPSSEINKQSLRSIQEILEENINLRTESCAGTLCQRLAREVRKS